MKLEKLLKKIAVLAFFVVAGWIAYQQWLQPFVALPVVGPALISTEQVSVSTEPYLTFTPATFAPTQGFIIYPGARVPAEAYAVLAQEIAVQGYLVVVPDMPLGLALFGESRADDIRRDHTEIQDWVIGGHSLGGAMAASFSDSNSRMQGLVLMGAYPGDQVDLSLRAIEVSVLYGDQDKLTTIAEVEASTGSLPPATNYVLIPGGNHSQFGSYGRQDGDGIATISPAEQREYVVREVVRILRSLK